jgi:hypothetical protein
MKIDPGMHIGLHLVFFGKTGVTVYRRSFSYPMHMIQNACNLRYKDAYTSSNICHAKCKKCTKKSYTYATKELPHTQHKRSNKHQAPPANE